LQNTHEVIAYLLDFNGFVIAKLGENGTKADRYRFKRDVLIRSFGYL
jgi:hypothetical protein